MSKKIQILFFVLAVAYVAESTAPAFINKCKSADSECLKESTKKAIPEFTKGIPDLKVEPIDPLSIKFINASQSNLIFLLHDVTAIGLRNCEALKIENDVKNSKFNCKFLCTGQLDGQYELSGSLLFIPIEGNGKIHVDLNSAEINMYLNYVNKIGPDGKNYWHIKTWSHDFELKGKSKVIFENLYEGNEVLGRAARDLVANNSNDVVNEIGPPVIKAVVNEVAKSIHHLFKAVPSEDLSLDGS